MKKYIRFGRTLYEAIDLAGAIFVAALVAMLVSAIWLSLDWICRNSISAWAIVCLIAGMAVSGTITAIFKNYNR